MKQKKIETFLLALILLIGVTGAFAKDYPVGYPQTQRTKTKLNASWKFHLGDADAKYYEASLDDSNWAEVNVPHSLKLTSINLDGVQDDKTQPTFHREVGWYRKTIKVGGDAHKKVFLEFEGAHQVTDLWVNGKHVGQRAVGGYTPFIFDVSDNVTYGKENQITLLVDNRRSDVIPPDPGPFNFIKFSGLYRDVYLVETAPVYITFNIESMNSGVTITTPSVDPVNQNATINIKTAVKNTSKEAQTVTVVNRVVDHNGCVVLKMLDEQTIASEAEVIFNQIGVMEANAKFWHPDHPYLYKVNTLVMEDDKTIDVVDHPLGIRTFELDAEQGFKLNGKPIKLIGYNRHQCFPYVGDAAPNSLHYKDMLQLKQMGFNAMRTSHYPQDDEIMRACDELGILVYEEPPSWVSVSQNPQWFANYEQASRVMVRNHRNHPSVVLWGAGINHRGAVPQIHAAIKQEDPTRLTASQNSRWTGWQTSWITDVYANMPYGPVSWERNEPMLAMEGDNGPEALAQIKRDPKMTGILSWVSHAYYTFHPSKAPEDRTWAGMWDIFRYVKRPDLMWYPTELKEAPMVYIPDAWKAGIKTLTVYSNAPEIELFVNDKSLGRYQPSKDLRFQGLNHPPYEIDIHHFEAGKLTAKGLYYGKVLAEQTVYTPGKPVALRFGFDKDGRIYEADGSDILIGHAEVVDANGTIIKNSDVEIEFSVKGKATLVGETEDIGSNPVKAKDGVASVLIRAGNTAGKVTVTARSKGLKSSGATIEMVASEENMMLANAYPIYDYERVRVDMGAQNQLLQFGWLPWNGTDNQPSAIDIDALGGFKAEVKTFSENGVLRWLGEMNVMGRNGYVYGDGALGIDEQGLVLEFKDLPAGKYKLKTYHHAPRSNTNSMDPNREKLKSVKIQHLPYAEVLKVMVEDKKGTKHHQNIEVTQGDEVQFRKPMTADATKLFGREKVECRPRPGALEMEFESDGNPIRFVFKDALGDRGVWLNGFELSENY